jgi:hypothetical protein
MSDPACGAAHPESGVRCFQSGNHEKHWADGPGGPLDPVLWENEDYVVPVKTPKTAKEGQSYLKGLVKKVTTAAGYVPADDGMERAAAHAPAEWNRKAFAAIVWVAEHQARLVNDDVWDVLDSWGVPRPPEPRALGMQMILAAKAGYIQKTTEDKPSRRRENSGRPVRIWRSLAYKPA